MLIDVPVSRSKILVVGGGAVAERKVRKLLQECPHVVVVSKEFTKGLKTLGEQGKVRLVIADAAAGGKLVDRAVANSDIVVVATSDPKVNGSIAAGARRAGLLVNAADNPSSSDFNFPASAAVGNVRIAVSTGGSSPAMAKMLCRRLGRQVSKTDQRQVKLQGDIRKFTTRMLPDSASRKRALYAVVRDESVRGLLERGRFGDARKLARQIIARESRRHVRE